MSQKPIAILGGTFDPVHNGHLRVAVELVQSLPLQHLRLIPCAQPPHRGEPSASPEARLTMLALATQGERALIVDDLELRRSGPSYSIDTLALLRERFPNVPLCLVMGRDAFDRLMTWHRWQALFELAHLIVLRRPGYVEQPPTPLALEIEQRGIDDPNALSDRLAGHILFWSVTQLDISSSKIRRVLSEGGNVRYLLPDSVLKFIKEQALYGYKKVQS